MSRSLYKICAAPLATVVFVITGCVKRVGTGTTLPQASESPSSAEARQSHLRHNPNPFNLHGAGRPFLYQLSMTLRWAFVRSHCDPCRRASQRRRCQQTRPRQQRQVREAGCHIQLLIWVWGIHFGVDEHAFATYVDVHRGYHWF